MTEPKTLFTEWKNGDPDAFSKLVFAIYPQLIKNAQNILRSWRKKHNKDPAELVNGIWEDLYKTCKDDIQDMPHLINRTNQMMRHVMSTEHKRDKALCRNEGKQAISLDKLNLN